MKLEREFKEKSDKFKQDLSDVPISQSGISKNLLRNEKFCDARMSFTNYEKAKV